MNKYKILIVAFFTGLILSAINPHDYFTWILEVFPAIIGFIILVFSFRKFRFTYLTYVMILLHCYILFVGGHYTYAEVPLFNWIKEVFHLARNDYDKVGHFAQGFIPAMIVREIFIRKQVVLKSGWIAFLTIAVCGAISAMYELLEWFVAITSGQSSEAFLGTQGDNWDTQSDMLCAFIGASCMILFFAGIQNRNIKKLMENG
jgi:putative membrane protein